MFPTVGPDALRLLLRPPLFVTDEYKAAADSLSGLLQTNGAAILSFPPELPIMDAIGSSYASFRARVSAATPERNAGDPPNQAIVSRFAGQHLLDRERGSLDAAYGAFHGVARSLVAAISASSDRPQLKGMLEPMPPFSRESQSSFLDELYYPVGAEAAKHEDRGMRPAEAF